MDLFEEKQKMAKEDGTQITAKRQVKLLKRLKFT